MVADQTTDCSAVRKGAPVQRYFFDLTTHYGSELDYVGRVCATPEEAYETAELMAFDLVVRYESETVGSAVTVSSAEGQKLFSVPVLASCISATPSVV